MLHNEARELLVAGYEKTHDAQLIADAYSVSKRTVYRLAQQKRETGNVELRTSQRGRKPALSEEDKARIAQCLDKKADMTFEEIREKLHLSASYATVDRAVVGMGYTRKKKSLHAAERDRSRCASKARRVEADHQPGDGR